MRLAQAYDDGCVYDFLRKHMRGWLGASADALLALCAHHGYALVAYELGSTEHTQCKNGKCRRIGTCTHCETNMWFVRADHLAAIGVAALGIGLMSMSTVLMTMFFLHKNIAPPMPKMLL